MKNILLGTRYYNDNGEVYKVVKIKNSNTFTLERNNNRFTVTRDQLEGNLTKLIPNGHILFSIVENNGNKDVIVALYRTKQIGEEALNNLPYCVCRQNIVNLFYEIANPNKKFTHVGMCVSIDTCPADTNYMLTIACDKIDYALAVAVYMDDSLDDILNLFRHDKFNIILNSYTKNNTIGLEGYVSTLPQLLEQESFSTDFYKAFNIHEINFKLKYDEESYLLDRDQTLYFEKEYRIEIFDAYIIKFDYSIQLKNIQKKYILIYSKPDKQLYILVYTEGRYFNDYMRNEIKNLKNQVAFFNTKLLK